MESKTINNDINPIKEVNNKFTDNMRSTIDSLLQSVYKISGINKKIAQVDNKEPDNKFTDNMRSMIDLLLKSVNEISEIDQKIAQIHKKSITRFFSILRHRNSPFHKSLVSVITVCTD